MEETKSFIPAFLRQPLQFRHLLRRNPNRGKLRIRLTPAGWGLGLLILVEFLLSVNFSNNLVFAMTFLLTAIAMIGWYHSRMNLTGLKPGDWKTEDVFAGQEALYTLSVSNRAAGNRFGLAACEGRLQSEEAHLAAGAAHEFKLYRPAPVRGTLEGDGGDLRSRFPLGVFETRLGTGDLPRCLVYPKPVGNQPIPDNSAGANAHLQAEAGTYTDMRRYCPGDPLSRISWKAFARFDELYTKEFDGASGKPALWLRWEDVKALGVEEKLSQLCRWVLDAEKKNCEYGLKLPGLLIEPASEEPHLRDCLSALALYETTDTQ